MSRHYIGFQAEDRPIPCPQSRGARLPRHLLPKSAHKLDIGPTRLSDTNTVLELWSSLASSPGNLLLIIMYDQLPLEIYLMILSYLDRGTLYALCLSCKASLARTQRSLFLAAAAGEVNLNETTRFLSFARAVFRWPELGCRVNELILNTGSMTKEGGLSRETFKKFAFASERHLKRDLDLWEEISNLETSCVIALLLAHTRRLKLLCLMLDRTQLAPITYLAHHMKGYLQDLDRLTVDCRPAFNLADVSPLLGLPNLQEFSCWGCIGNNQIVPGNPVNVFQASEAVNISYLNMRECCVDESCMMELVQRCRNLKSLIYEATNFPDIKYTNFSPSRLNEVLRSHQNQLQQLELSLDYLEVGNDMQLFQMSSPFDHFTNLEYLEIDQIYLREDHELPPNLRNLIVSNCIFPIFHFLRHIATKTSSALRFLNIINIMLPESPCILVLGIDFRMATEDLIMEKCDLVREIFEDTNVYIHFGEDPWKKVQSHRKTIGG
ncbi:hypothetical protein BDV12DRAFT_179390 [Aspergillus spectabilis]